MVYSKIWVMRSITLMREKKNWTILPIKASLEKILVEFWFACKKLTPWSLISTNQPNVDGHCLTGQFLILVNEQRHGGPMSAKFVPSNLNILIFILQIFRKKHLNHSIQLLSIAFEMNNDVCLYRLLMCQKFCNSAYIF